MDIAAAALFETVADAAVDKLWIEWTGMTQAYKHKQQSIKKGLRLHEALL